ncbi:hypothetical protein CEXT_63681 [Caerostris extrusa]|uniref:Uncharacterized protein n=1 Tax=Caerostris extrusa TaxID=172846 RepID=A0AAV4TXN2_CAEEX|nr:hypothetical protein CEXT_63681 [Caerostris extrusa]
MANVRMLSRHKKMGAPYHWLLQEKGKKKAYRNDPFLLFSVEVLFVFRQTHAINGAPPEKLISPPLHSSGAFIGPFICPGTLYVSLYFCTVPHPGLNDCRPISTYDRNMKGAVHQLINMHGYNV